MASLYSLERPRYNDNASHMKGVVWDAFEAFPSQAHGAIGRCWTRAIASWLCHHYIYPQPAEAAVIVRFFVLSANTVLIGKRLPGEGGKAHG